MVMIQNKRCIVIDGIEEQQEVFLEIPSDDFQILKGDIIMIQDFINEKKKDDRVTVLVIKHQHVTVNLANNQINQQLESIDENIEIQDSPNNPTEDEEDQSRNEQVSEDVEVEEVKNIDYNAPTNIVEKKKIPINYESKGGVNVEEKFSNQTENNGFGGKVGQWALTDILNSKSLVVSQMKVGMNRFSFKFEGKITSKSGIKYGQGDSKYFYINAQDTDYYELNISFWQSVNDYYHQLEVGSTYYFFGGEINQYNDKIELKFKKGDFDIILKENLTSVIFTPQHKSLSEEQSSNTEFYFPPQQSSNKNYQDNYSSRSSFSSNNNSKNKVVKKQVLSISNILTTTSQYLSVRGCVTDIQQGDRNIRLRIQDNSTDYEMSVIIFPELQNQWKDRFQLRQWYLFNEFVRQNYGGDIQLKNNKFSSIEEQDYQLPLIHKQKSFQPKQNQNVTIPDINKVFSLQHLIELAQESGLGERKEFIVYGFLVSIQMKHRLYYYKCSSCNNRATLKQNGQQYFCESCQTFVKPIVQLMLRAFIQDSTDSIPVMMFDYQSSFLINLIDPKIPMHEAGQYVKNCMENGKEETIRNLFGSLDYQRFKFEIQFENKEFNQEQEIVYKILKIEKANLREESKVLVKKIEQTMEFIQENGLKQKEKKANEEIENNEEIFDYQEFNNCSSEKNQNEQNEQIDLQKRDSDNQVKENEIQKNNQHSEYQECE